jgi:hypothetical protein
MRNRQPRAKRRTWWRVANRLFGARNIEWIQGDGPWAVVSRCPTRVSITLWPTHTRAQREKALIDRTQCGIHCWGPHRHLLTFLGARRKASGRVPQPSATETEP